MAEHAAAQMFPNINTNNSFKITDIAVKKEVPQRQELPVNLGEHAARQMFPDINKAGSVTTDATKSKTTPNEMSEAQKQIWFIIGLLIVGGGVLGGAAAYTGYKEKTERAKKEGAEQEDSERFFNEFADEGARIAEEKKIAEAEAFFNKHNTKSPIGKNYDADRLQKAHLELQVRFHPDRNPGNKSAEEMFKQAGNHYDCLIKALERKNSADS